jgi:hypothetical protein
MVARRLIPRHDPIPVARLDARLPIVRRAIQPTPKTRRPVARCLDKDRIAGAIWYESRQCDTRSIVAAITDYLDLVESET